MSYSQNAFNSRIAEKIVDKAINDTLKQTLQAPTNLSKTREDPSQTQHTLVTRLQTQHQESANFSNNHIAQSLLHGKSPLHPQSPVQSPRSIGAIENLDLGQISTQQNYEIAAFDTWADAVNQKPNSPHSVRQLRIVPQQEIYRQINQSINLIDRSLRKRQKDPPSSK